MTAAHWNTTLTVPHHFSENKSDIRGIKLGWYAIEALAQEMATEAADTIKTSVSKAVNKAT